MPPIELKEYAEGDERVSLLHHIIVRQCYDIIDFLCPAADFQILVDIVCLEHPTELSQAN